MEHGAWGIGHGAWSSELIADSSKLIGKSVQGAGDKFRISNKEPQNHEKSLSTLLRNCA
jgi:hypothetical protein